MSTEGRRHQDKIIFSVSSTPKSRNRKHHDEDEAETLIADEDTRIVNGYEPDERPWLVLIDVAGGSCGGAIINSK